MSAAKHTAVEALELLVRDLDATHWSSWQSTSKFAPALNVARQVLDRERVRDAAPRMLDALEAVRLAPLYAVLDEATKGAIDGAIAAATGATA